MSRRHVAGPVDVFRGRQQAADVLAGTHAFGAILAALWRRARSGRSACLDVSMLEALIAGGLLGYDEARIDALARAGALAAPANATG